MHEHKGVLVFMLLAGLSTAASGQDPVAEDDTMSVTGQRIHGNIGIYSDYLFRGISYGRGRGALQGTLEYTHPAGLFMGTAYTNVDKDAIYGNTYEIDLFGGVKQQLTESVAITTGFITYYYPQNNHYVHQHPHVTELNAAVDSGQFGVKLSYALTDWFGVNTVSMGHGMIGSHEMGEGHSRGSVYLEANYKSHIDAADVDAVFHIGHQWVRNYHIADYTDVSIGFDKPLTIAHLDGWNVGLSYVLLEADHDWYVASDGYKTAQNKLFGYIRLNL